MSLNVCIFCGANSGNSALIINQARELCQLLVSKEFNLVYGGGNKGLMGLVANEFLLAGREVIGVRPEKLIKDENVHDGLTELIVVEDMQQRKKKMVELSDVFIALPGGVGTLDEIIETYTLLKIGFINKPSGILNTANYYNGLMTLLDTMASSEFLTMKGRQELIFGSSPKDLSEKMGL